VTTTKQMRLTVAAKVGGALRRGMKKGVTRAQVAVWSGRTVPTVINWTREEDATIPDVVSFLVLCRRAEGPVRDELVELVSQYLPELELVEPIGSEDGSPGAT